MAWPTLAELKQQMGVTTIERDDVLARSLAAAIDQVQVDVGAAVDEPSPSLAEAAKLLAVMIVKAPDAPYGIAVVFDVGGMSVRHDHPTYWRLLRGHRVSWGVA